MNWIVVIFVGVAVVGLALVWYAGLDDGGQHRQPRRRFFRQGGGRL
ncbi:hypothetical protein [Streptomyces sp. WAC 06738]|nr:hypothetical protein [Streptomyces sp. WAC 06738]